MSLQSDLITALSAVASGKVYPQAVPADVELPFVVYRVINKDPLTTLNDSVDDINSIVTFESYADDYAEALSISADVVTAIEASGLTYYKTQSPGEDYEVVTDAYMEPVFFGFWHT